MILPSVDPHAWLNRLYPDVLGRPADAAGLASWVERFDQGATPAEIAWHLLTSPEARTGVVQTLYAHYLDRAADPLGLHDATALLDAGVPRERLAADVAGSAEFFATHPDFLDDLYHADLGRAVDASGRATFGAALAAGVSRAAVAETILTSPEARRDAVDHYYQQYLHRTADDAGASAWTGALGAGATDDQVVASILGSAEYLARLDLPAPAGGTAVAGTEAAAGADGAVVYSPAHDSAIVRVATGDPVTLAAPGLTLRDVRPLTAPGNPGIWHWGLLSFAVAGLPPGGSATVTLTLPDGARPTGYWKTDPATGAVTRFDFDGTTGAEIHANVITLHLRDDGGRSDSDGVANDGVIVDPGGPVANPSKFLATGSDAGTAPRVHVYDTATHAEVFNFLAYPASFRGGVRVALGDVNGDGVPDVITAPGPGGGSRVKAFDGSTGTLLRSFDAYAAGVTDGVFVAAADVNGDGYADVITGTDAGAQPLVKVFSGRDGSELGRFLAYDPNATGGVHVAAADVNGDGKADIVTGAGPGSAPRVTVFDGVTDKPIYDFFAYDPTFRGGVWVAAGDVNGDGQADLITGPGPGGRPEVRTFNGKDTAPLASFLAFDPSFQGGVRVSVLDPSGAGWGAIAAAAGPGDGQVQLFGGLQGNPLGSSFSPDGAQATAGLFVGSIGPTLPPGRPLDGSSLTVNVSIYAGGGQATELNSGAGAYLFTLTGGTGPLTINYTMGGTATNGVDYQTLSGSVTVPPMSLSVGLPLTAVDDNLIESNQTAVLTVQPGSGYTVGSQSTAAIVIVEDDDGPPPVINQPPPCCSGNPGGKDMVKEASGMPDPPDLFSDAPVRYTDGALQYGSTDLVSDGYGVQWGLTRSWGNAPGYGQTNTYGNGVVIAELPYLVQDSAGTIGLISNATTGRLFDYADGTYTPRYYLQDTLAHNTFSHEFVLADTTGQVFRFQDFSVTPTAKQGLLKSFTDPYGHVWAVTSYTSAGLVGELQRSDTTGGVTTTESFLYTYLTSGDNAGKLGNATLRRRLNAGSWSTIRQAVYTYYGHMESYGNVGDLKTAVIEDGSGVVLDTSYYRYYTSGQANGYQGGLRYAFGPESYARLVAAVGNAFTAADSAVAPYADLYVEYDASKRVTKETVQGQGCSSCSGGLGTYTYGYTPSYFPPGFNAWAMQTTVVLPDGNSEVVYTNFAGEVLLRVYVDLASGSRWDTYTQYDGNGRPVLMAAPSAVTGYDPSRPDLLNNQSGNYQYLSDHSGLIQITDWYASTNGGAVAGYYADTKVQQGELGTPVVQAVDTYVVEGANGVAYDPVATHTVYRNTDGTGAETTSYSYTWFSGTVQIQSMTATLPVISAAQNGPAVADQVTIFDDPYGRPIWTRDADGFINYTAYDMATGAVTKTITDVDTTKTGDFQNLPSGWATPAGGGLHLVTQYVVDALGRTTRRTDPNGNVTYTVYNDTNYEIRVYPGWQSATNTTTGPTRVYRQDRHYSTGYLETLTMSAAPHVTNGAPDGTEAVANVQTLSRFYFNAAGQNSRADEYVNLNSVSWSTSLYIGTQNTNFYATLFDYDSRGRLARRQLPTGTIQRVVYDGLSRVVSTWVGTNDTPGTGYWSPTNNTSPANMVQLTAGVYDAGGVGDGDLTQLTVYPGGSAAARVTQAFYDWRDRLVAGKQGVQASEDTTTHRPLLYSVYDNLGEAQLQEQFDGDGVTVTSSNGVPTAPPASLLRAETATSFDDQGRVYATVVYDVNQSTGAVSSTGLATNIVFNHRGMVVETVLPGGLVRKKQYDGAGRVVEDYSTDGAGGSSWLNALTVTGDHVLQQTDTQYDGDSNPIFVTMRQRFHNETATGALGNPTTTPKARVSYVAGYFDAVNRPTAVADVGTNGGTAYTRPGSVPSGSPTVLVTADFYNAAGWVQDVVDPRGLDARASYDNLGRRTQTIEDYTNGTPTATSNKTTNYTYDGDNHTLTLQAVETGGASETTQWVYGVTTAGGSTVNSNDVLAAVQYPDPFTGAPSPSYQETHTVNAVGQALTYTDRNGTTHAYTYDVLGRTTADAITTLAAGVDGSVLRLQIAYDTGDRPYLYTSFNAASGGSIVNQVQDGYNGLGQLVIEYQSHAGAVNPSTTPSVQYAYVELAGAANNSRLVSMTYPNGRVLTYNYNTGLDSTISRLSYISDTSATLESYKYLGLGTVVERDHPQTNVNVTYISQTGGTGDGGDQYTGLDRFGRVAEVNWYSTATGTSTDDFQYGYDPDGNPLYKNNMLNSAFSELYHASGAGNSYDGLNQLAAFARGTLSASSGGGGVLDTVASPATAESWSYDALGNWSSVTLNGTQTTRTNNQQNEVTAVGSNNLAFDKNGNTTTDNQGHTLVYDAWNMLVNVKNGSTTVVAYSYDGLHRRITENPGTLRDVYFSSAWQVVEEDVSGSMQDQYVWSAAYVGALVERDTSTQRLYVQQDANWNVTALVTASGSPVERYVYDPYGAVMYLTASWGTLSGSAYAWVYLHQDGRYDPLTVLYTFEHRDYSPTLGRWIRVDPIGFSAGDTNLYRAYGNAPNDGTDPTGRDMMRPGDGELGGLKPELPTDITQIVGYPGTNTRPVKPFQSLGPPLPAPFITSAFSQQNVLDYVEWRYGPMWGDLPLDDLTLLFQAATLADNDPNANPLQGRCFTWAKAVRDFYAILQAQAHRGKPYTPSIQVTTQEWDLPWGTAAFDSFLGHQAIKVILPDGAVFYLDVSILGGRGNGEHIFGPTDLNWQYKPKGGWNRWGGCTEWGLLGVIWPAVGLFR